MLAKHGNSFGKSANEGIISDGENSRLLQSLCKVGLMNYLKTSEFEHSDNVIVLMWEKIYSNSETYHPQTLQFAQ